MKLTMGVLAEAANTTADNKLNILGEFNTLFCDTFPYVFPVMYLVLKLEGSSAEGGRHRLSLRVVDDDGNLVAPPLSGTVDLGEPLRPGFPIRAQLIMGIHGAKFDREGEYTFELAVGEHRFDPITLYVLPASQRTK